MIIKVPVSRHIIEDSLSQDFQTRGILTITKGIPDGAQLVDVAFDGETVNLSFQIGDGEEVTEQDIVIRVDSCACVMTAARMSRAQVPPNQHSTVRG